jgi:tRNA dimethylallyltransferase
MIDGIFDGPAKDLAIRDRLEAEAASVGSDILHRRLSEIDSTYASSIDPNDLRRIVRGLEVFEITGETLSHLHSKQKQEQDCCETTQVAIDYPRPELYDRINRRVDGMFEAGFIEEVQDLLAAGYEEHILRLKSLGYREVIGHLRGETSLDEAVESMKMHTRRYAKRQLTWFRADTRIQWLDTSAPESLLFQLEQCLDATIG